MKDAADNVAEGFVQIFSKPQASNVSCCSRKRMPASPAFKTMYRGVPSTLHVLLLRLQDNDVKWATNDFKGKISHHGAGKPFKDGFSAAKPAKAEVTDAEQPQQEGQEVSGTAGSLPCRWVVPSVVQGHPMRLFCLPLHGSIYRKSSCKGVHLPCASG
jgi:hypothetical protein